MGGVSSMTRSLEVSETHISNSEFSQDVVPQLHHSVQFDDNVATRDLSFEGTRPVLRTLRL